MPGVRLLARYSRDLGVDLGTANTLVYLRGKGIVLREPSVIAFDRVTKKVVAAGEEARSMLGRAPRRLVVYRPLRRGVIADFDTTRLMLRYFLTRAAGRVALPSPRVVLSTPYGSTPVERRALIEATRQAGARDVFLVEEPVAAALGAGLPVEEPLGNLVINIGGGTTEIAVVSLGGVVSGRSLPVAGDSFNEAIQAYLRRHHHLQIGFTSAERLKITSTYACHPPGGKIEIKGVHTLTRLPARIKITPADLTTALAEPLQTLLHNCRHVLDKTPPQLAADLIQQGITLTGGGALLHHLDSFLADGLQLPVTIADDPLAAVVRGTAVILQKLPRTTRLQVMRA
ncbi:rod shape-determining protein [Moorella sp. Hama-1]|uniref:rod shape-determining protein n=1 Tax=Moorella sp. Hama-1 TaxID=2138101 RepID=UPI000D65E653|nr:rod shape-determining protein [Moorella sp. Hama-1]BCV20494.1 rod shape-determining protein [Moorella sp. Hama-1]